MIVKTLDKVQLTNLIRTGEIVISKTHIVLDVDAEFRLALLSAILVYSSVNIGEY